MTARELVLQLVAKEPVVELCGSGILQCGYCNFQWYGNDFEHGDDCPWQLAINWVFDNAD